MPGNAQQCRWNAAHCLASAKHATELQSREDFIALADTWNELAAELESDEGLLQVMSEMELSATYYNLASALNMRAWSRSPRDPKKATMIGLSSLIFAGQKVYGI